MYKYGLIFAKQKPYTFPKNGFIRSRLSYDREYLAYVWYSKPLSITNELAYHLRYLGREPK